MRSRALVPVIVSAAFVLTLSEPVFGAEKESRQGTTPAPEKTNVAEEAPKKAKRTLEKGMPAEEIVKLIGKPQSVAPMKTDEGKAETWTYRRLLDERTYQSADGQMVTQSFSGGSGLADTVVPVYRTKVRRTYQVTSLLLFDGELVIARQSREVDESYAD